MSTSAETARKRAWYQRNRERINAHCRESAAVHLRATSERRKAWRRAYYHKNKERLAEARARQQSSPLANAKTRLRGAKEQARKLGYVALALTAEEIVEKLTVEHCEICGGHIRGAKQHLDHDHRTGRFRGVLCARCNLMVGALENPLAEKARQYIEERSGR